MVSVRFALQSYASNIFCFCLLGWLVYISTLLCNLVMLRLEYRLGASLYELYMWENRWLTSISVGRLGAILSTNYACGNRKMANEQTTNLNAEDR